jgi:hypothetical protein
MYVCRSDRSASTASAAVAHSSRAAGSCSFSVARARCSALFTAETLISSTTAVSFAD